VCTHEIESYPLLQAAWFQRLLCGHWANDFELTMKLDGKFEGTLSATISQNNIEAG
jgi:hypothetical protein